MDKPRAAAGVLRPALGHNNVGLFGDRLHVVCQDPHTCEVKLREMLTAAAIQLQSIRQVEPSLEDVFISAVTAEGTA